MGSSYEPEPAFVRDFLSPPLSDPDWTNERFRQFLKSRTVFPHLRWWATMLFDDHRSEASETFWASSKCSSWIREFLTVALRDRDHLADTSVTFSWSIVKVTAATMISLVRDNSGFGQAFAPRNLGTSHQLKVLRSASTVLLTALFDLHCNPRSGYFARLLPGLKIKAPFPEPPMLRSHSYEELVSVAKGYQTIVAKAAIDLQVEQPQLKKRKLDEGRLKRPDWLVNPPAAPSPQQTEDARREELMADIDTLIKEEGAEDSVVQAHNADLSRTLEAREDEVERLRKELKDVTTKLVKAKHSHQLLKNAIQGLLEMVGPISEQNFGSFGEAIGDCRRMIENT
ncbi:MAG: hypothetical protein M1820_005077 [Bogoriella megaspora]|nr:MAG: hypothetical protein M1820_005077 [Bogoriella megaspora]